MGSYCSIHNDHPEDTVLVYVGVNPHVLQPVLWSITGASAALSGGVWLGALPEILGATSTMATAAVSVRTLTSCAGTLVSTTQAVVDKYQTQVVHDLTKGGYTKLLPGQLYTTRRLTLGLNLRAWVVRIRPTPTALILQRSNGSVWSGATPGSINVYRVMDATVFKKYTHESIPLLSAAAGASFMDEAPSSIPSATRRVERMENQTTEIGSTNNMPSTRHDFPWDEEDADTCIVDLRDYVQKSHLGRDGVVEHGPDNDDSDDDERLYTLLHPGIVPCHCTEIREQHDANDDIQEDWLSSSSWLQVDRVPDATNKTILKEDADAATVHANRHVPETQPTKSDPPVATTSADDQIQLSTMASLRQQCHVRLALLYPGA